MLTRRSFRVGSHRPPLRRTPRFLPSERLKPDISSQKSTFYKKSVESHSRSASIYSKLKEGASSENIRPGSCGKSQLKLLRSKSAGVLEETQSGRRRSSRLASQNGAKAFEIPEGFPDGNPRRQSMRLFGIAPVAENVKEMIENPTASYKVKENKSLEVDCKVVNPGPSMKLVAVTAEARKKWNEPEALANSKDCEPMSSQIQRPSTKLTLVSNCEPKIIPKKDCDLMRSHIRRSSRLLKVAPNGAMKRGVTLEMNDKVGKDAEGFNADMGDLVLESRIEDVFVMTKTEKLHKEKRKMEEGNVVENRIDEIENEECGGDKKENEEFRGTLAWTNEQEQALQKAYLMARPSPQFWKKVSKMVAGKSAQECFDKIHASIVTPLPRSRTKRKCLSPIGNFSLSGGRSITPHVSEAETAGRLLRRCKTKSIVAQKKTVRHLLRKHCLGDRTKTAADHFSFLESSSPINIAANLLDFQSPETSASPSLSQPKKMFPSFKLLTSPPPVDPSPQVLKQIRNRALHDRYIDQLHNREARRVMLAKKSISVGNGYRKSGHGVLKAARTALMSDAKSFINHFQRTQTDHMHEPDTDDSDDYYFDAQDIDAADLDE